MLVYILHLSLYVCLCAYSWCACGSQRTTLGACCMSSSFSLFEAGSLTIHCCVQRASWPLCSLRLPCLHLPFPRSAGMTDAYIVCPAFLGGFWEPNSDPHACIGNPFTHFILRHFLSPLGLQNQSIMDYVSW